MAREARIAAEKRRKRLRGLRNAAIAAVVVIGGAILISVLTNNGGSKKTESSTTVSSTPTTVAKAATYPAGCTGTKPVRGSTKTYTSAPPMTIDPNKTYVAHVKTSCGTFDITLDAKDAPTTVNSFVFLANERFYDGLTFHRLVPDFVIQGGDPQGNGLGGPGYKLPDEPPKNGYTKGSVAMANSGPGTSGSQFFVTVSDNGAKTLGGPPYKYSILGNITKGFDAVDRMMKLAPAGAGADGSPQLPLYIDTVTITES